MMAQQKPAIAFGGSFDDEGQVPITLLEALDRAARQDVEKGITYIRTDGTEAYQSYSNLYEDGQTILAGLHAYGLRPGDKVILQIADHKDYLSVLWACVLGGLVSVPISIASDYGQPNITTVKLQKAWELCNRPMVVASSSLVPTLRAFATQSRLEPFRLETVDTLRASLRQSSGYHRHGLRPDDIVLILFTSGSTGIPKGVVLTHRSILHAARGFTQLVGRTNQGTTFNWMPLEHVAGLVAMHLCDVYVGCQQVHASPQTVFREPLTWLDYLDHYRATCSMAPNFAFGLINEHAAIITQHRWDLSALRCLLNVGETIVPRTARRFLALLTPYGLPSTALHPGWGLTEASSAVAFSTSFSLESTTDGDRFVDVGTPIPGVDIRVVNQQNQVLAESIGGHIQIKGPSVTPGYYGHPELNQEVFSVDGWFDTGDIGFLNEGHLTITGRSKDLIIVNGLNYYSHEIEAVVEEVTRVEASYTAACAIRNASSHTDTLAIFYSTQLVDEHAIAAQFEEIRHHVVAAMGIYPAYLIPLEKAMIPKTSIGKIQRSRLKQQFEDGAFDDILQRFTAYQRAVDMRMQQLAMPTKSESLTMDPVQPTAHLVRLQQDVAYKAPATIIEQRLAAVWQDVLQIDRVGIHDNFFALGGDSLLGIQMVSQAHKVGIRLLPKQIFQHQTIAELATVAYLAPASGYQASAELDVGELPFTSGQVWLLTGAFNPHHFNEEVILEVLKALDPILVEQTLGYLIGYHDALRLRFIKEESGWKQFLVPPKDSPPLTWVDLAATTEAEQRSAIETWTTHLHTSLNLFDGPTMQMAYFDLGVGRSGRLVWIFNHVIIDYFSIALLIEDFQTIYEQLMCGEPAHLPQKTTSLKHWVERVQAYVQPNDMQREMEAYWLKLPWNKLVSLPLDYPAEKDRSTLTSIRTLDTTLDRTATLSLGQIINGGTQMLDILLMVLVQTFCRWTGSPWLLVSVLNHGRNTPFDDIDLSRTVGYIAYGRRLLLEFPETITPDQALRSLQKQIATIPQGGISYEWLFYLGNHAAQLGIVPPPEVKLNYFSRVSQTNLKGGFLIPTDEYIGPIRDPREQGTSPSSITLTAELSEDQLKLSWAYNERLYRHASIEQIAQSFSHGIQEYIRSSEYLLSGTAEL